MGVLRRAGRLGSTAITYNAPLKKFLLFTTHGWPSVGAFDTMVLEADELTGPWRLVTYLKDFGPQAYFVNVPSKFISDDGRTMWLLYSANFREQITQGYGVDPPGSGYAMSLHKIRLLGPGAGRSAPLRPAAGRSARVRQNPRVRNGRP